MADFSTFFGNLKSRNNEVHSEKKSKSSGFELDLAKTDNHGIVNIRLIPDETDKPMRSVYKVYEVGFSTPMMKDDGTPELKEDGTPKTKYTKAFIGDPMNYSSTQLQLTQEQTILLNDCIDALNKFDSYTTKYKDGKLVTPIINTQSLPGGFWTSYRREITFFWGKTLSLTGLDLKNRIEAPKVSLIRHHSMAFGTTIIDTILQKDAVLGSGAWQSGYFNRNVGNQDKIMSISNKKDGNKYAINVQFTDGVSFELTDKDIEQCTDLNAQLLDITRLDSDLIRNITEQARRYVAEADAKMQASNGLVASAQSVPGIDANQLAPNTPVNPATMMNEASHGVDKDSWVNTSLGSNPFGGSPFGENNNNNNNPF